MHTGLNNNTNASSSGLCDVTAGTMTNEFAGSWTHNLDGKSDIYAFLFGYASKPLTGYDAFVMAS